MAHRHTDRALLRHHDRRRKEQVRWFIRCVWREPALADNPRFVGQMARTPHPCSGMCCGNRRPWEGLTRQEIRAVDRQVEAMEG